MTDLKEPDPGAYIDAQSSSQPLLLDLHKALEVWLHTYAAEFCETEKVLNSQRFLRAEGGTISYISKLRQRIEEALKNE